MFEVLALIVAVPVAVLFQGVALHYLLHPSALAEPLTAFLGAQALAAAGQAVVFRRLLPAAQRFPRGAVLAQLWLLSFLVPCVGGLLEVVVTACGVWLPLPGKSRAMTTLGRPAFVSYLVSRVSHGGGARVQSRLANENVATHDRLAALVAIQHLPTRTTGGLLRDLLADPVDDLRLLAYGRLDQAENEIVTRISDGREALEHAQEEDEIHMLHHRLAELHFELVYQRLAQGDVHAHTIGQAEAHVRAALAVGEGERDAALWLLRARLALARGAAEEAGPFLERARALGFPRERLLPWLAEVAFRQGRHTQASEIVGELAARTGAPALKAVVEYWTR